MSIRQDDCYFCEKRFDLCTIARPKDMKCEGFTQDPNIIERFNCRGCVRATSTGYPSTDTHCLKCTSNVHYKGMPAGVADFYERRILPK